MLLLHHLHHVALAIALIPGSLVFVGMVVWRAARRVVGFSMPPMPLRSPSGAIVCTEDDWRRQMKEGFPIRYAVFETFPRALNRLGRNLIRPFRLKTSKEAILFKAFGVFVDWAEANGDTWWNIDWGDLLEPDEEGPRAQRAARGAEIWALYGWWKGERPAAVRRIEEAPLDNREYLLLQFELDDQVHLARLANIWRDLT